MADTVQTDADDKARARALSDFRGGDAARAAK